MNEELQTAVTELINKSINGIDTTTEFLQAQLPDVVSQLLMWHGLYSAILMVVGLALVVASPVISYKLYKWLRYQYHNVGAEWTRHDGFKAIASASYEGACIGSFVVPLIAMMIGLFIINLEWLQIWIAPKVWLIEYAAQLAK